MSVIVGILHRKYTIKIVLLFNKFSIKNVPFSEVRNFFPLSFSWKQEASFYFFDILHLPKHNDTLYKSIDDKMKPLLFTKNVSNIIIIIRSRSFPSLKSIFMCLKSAELCLFRKDKYETAASKIRSIFTQKEL